MSTADRDRLADMIGDRNRPLKHIQRAKIVLDSGDRLSVLEMARRAGVSRPSVWRWQQRFAEEGVDGPLRDKTRKPGTAPVAPAVMAQTVTKTCSEPPRAVTHWTGRAMAEIFGVSLRPIQALDRTQPGLPLKPGTCTTVTHDYKRHGTTTLFAALDVLPGTVVGRRMPKHTRAEFIKFLSVCPERS